MGAGSPREIRVPVVGGEIVGHVHGTTGSVVMLIASVGLGERVWWHTAEVLSAHHRVVTFSIRGHGRSTCEIGDDLEEVLRDVVAVADAITPDRPTIVGYEFGAAIAALTVTRFPERFAALGVVDTPIIMSAEAYKDLLDVFRLTSVQDEMRDRYGLGASGDDAASFERFLDVMAPARVHDWIGRVPDEATAREWLAADTLVLPSGSWQRRPTVETCCRIADVPESFFAQPGRELLAELPLPVWVLQPAEGRYGDALEEFLRFAAQSGRRWRILQPEGGPDLFTTDRLADALRSLLMRAPEADGLTTVQP